MSETEIHTDDPVGGARRVPPILVALLVVVALAGLYFVVVRPLLAGDPEAELALSATDPEVQGVEEPEPTADELAPADEAAVDPLAVTYELLLTDPFEPVVPEPVAAGVDAIDGTVTDGVITDGTVTDGTVTDGVVTDGTVTDGVVTDGTVTDGVVTDGTSSETGTPDGVTTDDGEADGTVTEEPETSGCEGDDDTITCDGRLARLVEVRGGGSDPLAVVQVDSTMYEVAVGDTFAESFRLRSVAGKCATIEYRDEAFELCQGPLVLK